MSTVAPASVPLEELAVGRPTRIDLGGDPVCLLRTAEREVIAFADACPHRGHPLSEGSCAGGVLRCVLHGWEFAVPGGEAVSPRAPFGLKLFNCRINDEGNVEVIT